MLANFMFTFSEPVPYDFTNLTEISLYPDANGSFAYNFMGRNVDTEEGLLGSSVITISLLQSYIIILCY